MGSGVYSSIAYNTLSDDRGYTRASRDQLFKNVSVDASNTAASFNVNARSFNTQVKAEMVNVGVRECRDSQVYSDNHCTGCYWFNDEYSL